MNRLSIFTTEEAMRLLGQMVTATNTTRASVAEQIIALNGHNAIIQQIRIDTQKEVQAREPVQTGNRKQSNAKV